jgi:protein ImuB
VKWLALHFPALAIEVLSRPDQPLAVLQGDAQPFLLGVNPLARQLGLRPGMAAAQARTLAPQVRLAQRQVDREQSVLEGLALFAGRFSSLVEINADNALLLEVAGSERLFGGVDALLAELQPGLVASGHAFRYALAPTPQAALLWAGRRHATRIADARRLRALLAGVPLNWLGLGRERDRSLAASGLTRVADLLRLPRAAIGQRYGWELVDCLDRLLDRRPDPRTPFRPAELFDRELELPSEVHAVEALAFAARRLLGELHGFLRLRAAATQHLRWWLLGRDGVTQTFDLGSALPEQDAELFLELLRERLQRLRLVAPVRGLRLRVERLQDYRPRQLDWLRMAKDPGEAGRLRLWQRLRARLGEEVLRQLGLCDDYRPERAWRWSEGERRVAEARVARRPLWLLPRPLRLQQQQGRPCYRGRLELLPEGERIESGWWQEGAVARDYFVARAAQGQRLWVFRELDGQGSWYLHGIFD